MAEKDISLAKENSRYWSEISLHKYQFGRQATEIEELRTLTKEDLLAHFEKVFYSPETKRVDLALTAEHHKSQNAEHKETNAKSEMFTSLLKLTYTDMDGFKEAVSYHDDIVKTYWLQA